jgi:hypothetical protein
LPKPGRRPLRAIGVTDRILAAKKEDATADTSELEAAIETKIFDLYGLSDDERELVMAPTS